LSTALASASTLLGVIALGVFAASFAGEYSNGTLRNLLVCEPRRARLLWGKFAGLASATVPAVGIAVVVSAGGAMVAAQAKGIDVGAWWTAAGVRHSAVTAAYLLLATLGWGLFGAVLALWFRSPVVAISVGVAYALPLEAILGGVASGAARWLPGKLLAAIAAGGNDTVGFTTALVTFAVYAAAASAAATTVFVRRDVAT
jgi:ABC-type transport system involved in multi-copper enzyme maturation permease subunit